MNDGKHMKQRRTQHSWTGKQEEYLIAIMALEDATYENAAKAMQIEFGIQRSVKAVEVKHLKLTGKIVSRTKSKDVPKRHKTSWKGRQEAFVLENYNQMPLEDLAIKLGRTPKAVSDRYHLLMRVRGTSVVFRNELGNPVIYDGADIAVPEKEIHYPDYIPKRWIIKEIKQQYKAQIRDEKAESKQRIKWLKEEMKQKIKQVKE